MPKRKAQAKLSGFVGSDDDDLMGLSGGETIPQEQEPHDEPPAKKRRGRPRTSNEIAAETKTAALSKKQEPSQVPEEEAPAKATRRGRPRGTSDTAEPSRASIAKEPVESQEEIQEQEITKGTRTTRTGRSTATRGRGRGRGRTASVARPSATDGDFEYTPTRAQPSQKEAEIPDTQMNDVHATAHEHEVEESMMPEPSVSYTQSSITKNAKARAAAARNNQGGSPQKRKSGVATEQGDPELRRRIGDLTRKNDTLESKYRDLREIGVEEAKTNMDKLRKQCESITIGMLLTVSHVFLDRLY